MVDSKVVDIAGGDVATLVAETCCRFQREVTFRDSIEVGLRVARLGSSSVRYEIGIFTDAAGAAAAEGYFIHVFVDRSSKRPTPIPDAARTVLQRLELPAEGNVA